MPSYSELRIHRFGILFCCCMLTFGSFYAFDMPSSIQTELQDNMRNCTHSLSEDEHNSTDLIKELNFTSTQKKTCCPDCLGLGPFHYNLLFAMYAWTASVNVLIAGILVDKVGTRFCAIFYGSIALSGSMIFALAIYQSIRGTSYMFTFLMIGRLLLGCGNSGLRIVQDRVTAFWFRHQELSLAFGINLTFSRLGSSINFVFTSKIVKKFGLEVLFWSCAFLCLSGFIFAIILSILDHQGLEKLMKASRKDKMKKHSLRDICDYSATYWLLIIVTMLSYSTIIPYIADSSKLYQDKYNYNHSEASVIAGIPYYVSIILAPLLGILVDHIGYRGYLMIICSLCTLPVLPLLAFTSIPAYVVAPIIGLNYTFSAISLWPSVPLLVKPRALGTGMGILTSIHFIGIGLTNVGMGKLLNLHKEERPDEDWMYVLLFLTSICLCCLIFSVLLNVVDRKKDNVLNKKSTKCLTDSNCSSYFSASNSLNMNEETREIINKDFRSRIAPNYQSLLSSASSFNSQASLT